MDVWESGLIQLPAKEPYLFGTAGSNPATSAIMPDEGEPASGIQEVPGGRVCRPLKYPALILFISPICYVYLTENKRAADRVLRT